MTRQTRRQQKKKIVSNEDNLLHSEKDLDLEKMTKSIDIIIPTICHLSKQKTVLPINNRLSNYYIFMEKKKIKSYRTKDKVETYKMIKDHLDKFDFDIFNTVSIIDYPIQ